MLGFLFFEATTVEEFGRCFYGLVALAITFIDFQLTIQKMPYFLKLIENVEDFIEKSA